MRVFCYNVFRKFLASIIKIFIVFKREDIYGRIFRNRVQRGLRI